MFKTLDKKITYSCDHCGDDCNGEIYLSDKKFCCQGCKTVYGLLEENGLSSFYSISENAGLSQKNKALDSYEFLDDEQLKNHLLSYRENGIGRITLSLPDIHCSSCLWLLENIYKFNKGIHSSKVDFLSKKATIQFSEDEISLRSLATLLSSLGYPPELNHSSATDTREDVNIDKSLLYKLGLAGFVFGNIMLLSFPEYLGFENAVNKFYIGYINIILATPVLLYSGQEYWKSAWLSLKRGHLNLDVPIVIGMFTLYFRSVYDILSGFGEGYLDSFSGFVFFLLIGKWFQKFTYHRLDFERNYKSYFPISVLKRQNNKWISSSLDQLCIDDHIQIKHGQIIPADSILLSSNAIIDYSFVTGESDAIAKTKEDLIYAGGRNMGKKIKLSVQKEVTQGHLIKLWDNEVFKKTQNSRSNQLIDGLSKYFVYFIILLASGAFVYYKIYNPEIAFTVVTSILIVACPCALALAIPFTYGSILRIFSKQNVFIKNVNTIQNIQDIDHIVFDKTGTLSDQHKAKISYHGTLLNADSLAIIKSACDHSSHPISNSIANHLSNHKTVEIEGFEEVIGKGLIVTSQNTKLRLGSEEFIFNQIQKSGTNSKEVYVEIDGKYKGKFCIEHHYRTGAKNVLNKLSNTHHLSLISGDDDKDLPKMQAFFPQKEAILFNQSPNDKLNYIKALQKNKHHVLMIGDGLNDAGALRQSDVGIVISDNTNNFSPSCDIILNAQNFDRLYSIIDYLKKSKYIIYGAFVLAFLYNTIGLYFAITGVLSPIIAAILMPLSSISVILYGVIMSHITLRSFSTKS